MNKIVCSDCGYTMRVKAKFEPGKKCPVCRGKMGIHIKGSRELYSELPDAVVRIPRHFRPTLKDGSVCNKSAIRGALPCSGST